MDIPSKYPVGKIISIITSRSFFTPQDILQIIWIMLSTGFNNILHINYVFILATVCNVRLNFLDVLSKKLDLFNFLIFTPIFVAYVM